MMTLEEAVAKTNPDPGVAARVLLQFHVQCQELSGQPMGGKICREITEMVCKGLVILTLNDKGKLIVRITEAGRAIQAASNKNK